MLTVDQVRMTTGLILVGIGILLPSVLTIRTLGIYPTLELALAQDEAVYVIIAALKLVILNVLRCFPHYLGAFFLGEAVRLTRRGKPVILLRVALVLLVIPAVYALIGEIYHIQYDFGVPAVVMIGMLVILGKIDFNFVNLSKKALMVMMLTASLQFLDLVPSLTRLAFGRGETSQDIKAASSLLGANTFLEGTVVVFFGILLFNAVLLCKLIMDENNLKMVSEQKEHNERILMETRMRVLENRTYMEMQHLVHDLKSPLTSAQALVGVVKMSNARDGRAQDCEYLEKVERSIERMSGMISEILYGESRTRVTAGEVAFAVLAQISITEYATLVQTDNRAPDAVILVNTTRFIRAIINLIENSFYAVEHANGIISLTIDRCRIGKVPGVCFEIIDNGGGIAPEIMELVWEHGFSTRSSHGFGLNFVRSVIEQNGGVIDIHSAVGHGTTVTIQLPEEETI